MRIFTATPMAVLKETDQDYNFFCRDMGLTCYGLRALGVESQVVLLDFPEAKKHPDIVRATLEQMKDPQWWRKFNLDAVVLGAWAAPRYTPIAKAIQASGTRLIVRCDSGGPYSQWQRTLRWAFYINYLDPRYRGHGLLYSVLFALIKTPLHYLPAVYEKKVMEHMACADLILNETPEGVRCLKALMCRYGRMDVAARVKYVPHPVAGEMSYSPDEGKEKRIIGAGRWSHYSKNTPLLMRSLGKILAEYPEYEAHLFGSGEATLEKCRAPLPEDVKRRIHIRGKIPNTELATEYKKSQILFMPSRSEGSSVAAEEALACGCSVVGSAHIFCMRNFVLKNSGTLARHYSVKGMVEALTTEIRAWDEGLRDPAVFSIQWSREFGLKQVSEIIIRAVKKG